SLIFFFFFQAEDGIRDFHVTGVQTCALPIYTVTEDDGTGLVSGNVVDNDVHANGNDGADGKSFKAWGSDGTTTTSITDLATYGTFTKDDTTGAWSFQLDNSKAAVQALTSSSTLNFVLNYTIEDADGDEKPATLTIVIKGADDGASVVTAALTGPDETVYEAGLPTGSLADDSHETTGTFTISATDGIKEIVVGGTTFTLAQIQAFATTNGAVDTGEGTLTLTGYTCSASSGTVSYCFQVNSTID